MAGFAGIYIWLLETSVAGSVENATVFDHAPRRNGPTGIRAKTPGPRDRTLLRRAQRLGRSWFTPCADIARHRPGPALRHRRSRPSGPCRYGKAMPPAQRFRFGRESGQEMLWQRDRCNERGGHLARAAVALLAVKRRRLGWSSDGARERQDGRGRDAASYPLAMASRRAARRCRFRLAAA